MMRMQSLSNSGMYRLVHCAKKVTPGRNHSKMSSGDGTHFEVLKFRQGKKLKQTALRT